MGSERRKFISWNSCEFPGIQWIPMRDKLWKTVMLLGFSMVDFGRAELNFESTSYII